MQRSFGLGVLVMLVGVCLLAPMGVSSTPQTNLLVNGGFEENVRGDPWSEFGGTLTIISDPVFEGAQAAMHQDSSGDSAKTLQQDVPITAGVEYRFSAWAYYPSTSAPVDAIYIRLAWYANGNCGGAQMGTVDGGRINPALRGSWQQLTGVASAPDNARCAQLRLTLDPVPGEDPVIYWDSAYLGSNVALPTGTPTATYTPSESPTATSSPTHTATYTPTPTPTSTATATAIPGRVTLNEYMPNPASGSEYVELFNANPYPVDLGGWQIDDSEGGSAPLSLVGRAIPAGGVEVIYFSRAVLNNSGDSVRLFAPDGSLRDSHSYANAQAGVPWSRYPDGSGPWQDRSSPSPGQPNPPPATATPTPQATSTPTPSPSPTNHSSVTTTPTATAIPGRVTLNEYMPNPASGSEYVELFNANPFPVDLGGWQIDDSEGGSAPLSLVGRSIPAGGVEVIYFSRAVLNNSGDSVRLFAPDGSLRDSHSYTGTQAGVPWSRYPDGSGPWQDGSSPSPGQPNPPPPTATPTPSPTHTATATAAATVTPTTSPSPTPAPTFTVTPTATAIPGRITLNEYMPNPAAGDEYVELFNANPYPVDLGGWQIDDSEGGTSPYTLPAGTAISAQGYLLVERKFGFNNDGDRVRLFAPDGSLRDSHSYLAAADGLPWSRLRDGNGAWTDKYPASPGDSNRAARLTLSGHLYQGSPPARSLPIRGHYIGLYGWDAPNTPGNWLANAPTAANGGFSLEYDTATALYYHYTLRPAPLPGLTWTGASSELGVVLQPDRIRFDHPASGAYTSNDFWMAPLPTTTATVTPLPANFVVINEILPSPRTLDFDGSGEADLEDEYIELYNPGAATVDLSGWQIDDGEGGSRAFTLPPGSHIAPAGFLLFFRRETGVALNNDGDSARLLAPGGAEIDRFDYESARADTPWSRAGDGAATWTDAYPPSPGGPNLPPTAPPIPTASPTPTANATKTSTPTAVPSPTASPTATPTTTATHTPSPTNPPPGFVLLNEILPSPRTLDFDGSGEADLEDEYIELYNPGAATVDLSGWQIDDGEGGSRAFTLPPGSHVAPAGFLLFFRSDTGVALNNDGDSARLLAPSGAEIDRFDYESARADTPWSRAGDGAATWTDAYPPSPGGPNLAPTATPTPSPSPTATLTATATATATPPPPGLILLNEILPAPANIDWDGDGAASAEDEYIELYNPQDFAIELGGWWLDDIDDGDVPVAQGSKPYLIPAATRIQAGGFLLFFRSDTGVALNNDGDSARLLAPGGIEIDHFDFPRGHGDIPWSRSAGGGWTEGYPPSPGGPNLAPTATPTPTGTLTPTATPTPTLTPTPYPTPAPGAVALNELLPAPRLVDWDGDGVATFDDEWIELYNGGAAPADLTAWRLWKGEIGANGLPDGFYYQFPPGVVIAPHDYLLIFRRQSDLSLPASEGNLHLVRSDGRVESSFRWVQFPGFDRAFSRYPDGTGPWGVVDVTPGRPNRPFPEHGPQPPARGGPINDPGLGVGVEAIQRAYELAPDTRITVEGSITVPPGLFDSSTAYLEDASAGLKLYLRQGDYPALRPGDRLRASGYVHDFHGQRELSIPGPTWLTALGPGQAPRPRYLRTGAVDKPFEGRLLLVVGRITGFSRNSFWLDDGSGEARVIVDENLPWRRPFFQRDDEWAVIGVVGQWDGGFRLLPRYETDISLPPNLLPATGRGMVESPEMGASSP